MRSRDFYTHSVMKDSSAKRWLTYSARCICGTSVRQVSLAFRHIHLSLSYGWRSARHTSLKDQITLRFHVGCDKKQHLRIRMQWPTSIDLEKGERPVRDGYPYLAAWIAHDNDSETYVFRKFGHLSVRNLLNLQSQLLELEVELGKLDGDARKGIPDMESARSLRRWATFQRHARDASRPEFKRMNLEMQLKERIKEHRTYIYHHRPTSMLDLTKRT